MAQITLSADESFTVSGGTNTITGKTNGHETVYINGGVNTFDADFNAGGDTIVLAGSASQYQVSRSGSTITLTGPGGVTIKVPAPNPNLTAAQQPHIVFDNGTANTAGDDTSLALASTTGGTFTLGTQTITTTATTVTGGGTTPPTPSTTVNVTATDVTEGSGDIVFTFTLSSPQTSAVVLQVNTNAATGTPGIATPGQDFTAFAGQVTFAPGQTTAVLTIPVINDTVSGEGNESVTITVTPPAGITLAGTADLTAIITDNETVVPQEFRLSTANDTFSGDAANDRFVGAQDINQPGKLLSANDVLNGAGGTDTIELTNAPGGVAQVIADLDFTNVSSIETLVTNYGQIQLGKEADEAGITTVDTATRIDAQNVAGIVFAGTTLDLTLDANGDGLPDFNNVLTVNMANSVADTVRLNLATSGGSVINTGTTFAFTGGGAPFAALDTVVITGQVNPVRVTFTAANIGDGSAFDTGTTTLAVQLQSEDTADGLTGGITRVDDEGLVLTGATFDVRDGAGATLGNFNEVRLGTSLNDTLNTGVGTGGYVNGGGGNDAINGGGGIDYLVGGAGNDVLTGFGSNDTLFGGAGNDVLNGGAGIDLMDGGEGSDTYVFANGEFDVAETITDTGTTGTDTLNITSVSPITDAQFVGKNGFEALTTNVTNAAGDEVTIGANAQASGIRTVNSGDDDLNASAYTVGLTVNNVFGTAAVQTGSGADTVNLNDFFGFAGSVVLDGGDDTLNAAFSLGAGSNNVLNGGTGTDTLTLGALGVLGAGNAFTYTNPFGANFTNFEKIVINAVEGPTAVTAGPDVPGSSVSYTLTFVDANVATGTTFVVDGSAMRAGVVTNYGTDNEPGGTAGAADTLTDEVLTVNAGALTGTRAVNVTGGAAGDSLTGGAGADTLNGGAGNDMLVGGAGNDILNGGAGRDTLTGGAGTDTMDGGADGDFYVFANGELTAADVINDTGSGAADWVQVTSATAITDAQFANKAGVENLQSNVTTGTTGDLATNGTNAEVTLGSNAQAAGIVYVLTDNDDLFAGSYTVGLTVDTASGAVTTGSGNDTVNIAPANFTYVAPVRLGGGDDVLNGGYAVDTTTAVMDGGTGSDTFVLGGDLAPIGFPRGSIIGGTFTFGANFTNFERLNIMAPERSQAVAGGPDLRGTVLNVGVVMNDANVAAGTTFIVDATSLVATETNLGADNELGGTGANADTINTSTLNFNGAAESNGNFDVRSGAGNDIITTGAGADIIDGGAGNDVINGGAGADTIHGGDGNDVISGGAGFDKLFGDAGDDTIALTVPEFNSDADTVDGGTGNDTLQITGTAASQDIADVGFNGRFTSIEQVTLVGAPGGTAFTYTAGFYSESSGVRVINLGANTSGSTVSVANYVSNGATLNDTIVTTNNAIFIGSNQADTFNLGTANTAQGGGTDVVRAGGGNDTINFGSTLDAADIIDGGAGSDTLTVSGDGTAGLQTRTVNLAATVAGGVVTSGIFSVEALTLAAGKVFTDNTAPTNDVVGTATAYNVTVADSSFDGANATLTVDGSALRAGVITAVDGTGQSSATANEVLTFSAAGVTGAGHAVTVTGGGAADSITGGAGNDTLNGGGGNDTINGGNGNDTIDGGTGNDTLNGGAGNDTITGGAGQDTITGGAGVDTYNLGADGARDTVIIANGDAPRGAVPTVEVINGFQTGSTTAGYTAGTSTAGADAILGNADDTFTGGADVIDFGSGIVANGMNAAVVDGVVQASSGLQSAINSSTSLLAAIQLVEQEFNTAAFDGGQGVVAFTYQGNTFIGELTDTNAAAGAITAAFTDIVQLSGVTGGVALIDVDGAGGSNALGLAV